MTSNQPRLSRLISAWTASEIRQLFKQSQLIYRSPGLDIRISVAKADVGKILVVTPKKMGSAPSRNLIRRRLKSIFYQDKLYAYKCNVAIICKKESDFLTFDQLREILSDTIKSYCAKTK